MAASHAVRPSSLSPSLPPVTQNHTLSKRDRRRAHIENRVKEIAANLVATRDVNIRTQLNTIQRDIAFVTRAELYTRHRLDDHPDDLVTEVTNVNALGAVDAEPQKLPLGRHAARFVERVNNVMDERDGHIANLHRQFLNRLDAFKREYDFSIQVAAAEEQALREAARLRVVNSLQARKRALQKDREVLDSADTNAMLHGAGISLTVVPGSPGGLHSNRKTRHGRHTRQEQENVEVLEGAKRKRKADHEESPGPISRGAFVITPWDKTKEIATAGEAADIAKFFSAKDLSLHYRQANMLVAENWVERQPLRGNNGLLQLTDEIHTNGKGYDGARDSGDDEEIPSSMLVAPAMDRTGSHATRSTRNNQPDITSARDAQEALKNPERTYGLAVLEALGSRQAKPAKADLEAPWTASLTSSEQLEDRVYLDGL